MLVLPNQHNQFSFSRVFCMIMQYLLYDYEFIGSYCVFQHAVVWGTESLVGVDLKVTSMLPE